MSLNDVIKSVCKEAYLASGQKNDRNYDEFKYEDQFDNGWWPLNKEEVLKECHADLKGVRIIVEPVTHLVNLSDGNEKEGLAWGVYKGWTGWIVGEIMNGINPAYKVKISGNGVSYITLNINKTDIKLLSDNE